MPESLNLTHALFHEYLWIRLIKMLLCGTHWSPNVTRMNEEVLGRQERQRSDMIFVYLVVCLVLFVIKFQVCFLLCGHFRGHEVVVTEGWEGELDWFACCEIPKKINKHFY